MPLRCDVCPRGCILSDGNVGYCGVRVNKEGANLCRTYGRVAALHVSPSEIKPFFHFKPGAKWLSVGGLGCNLRCPGCQNHHIAHSSVSDEELLNTEHLDPNDLVRLAMEKNCVGISFTYNEPIIWWEFVKETALAAKKEGLLVNLVTNGYATEKIWSELLSVCDAVRIDFKGYSAEVTQRSANFKHPYVVRRNAKAVRNANLHLEIISNIIPTINDDEADLRRTAEWIVENLGSETPWHITRFVPHLHLSHLPPTPVSTLERGRRIGLEVGLRYVYIGNVPGHPAESTYCPECGTTVVKRIHLEIVEVNLDTKDSKCLKCGTRIKIVW